MLTRRLFLKGAGALAAALAFGLKPVKALAAKVSSWRGRTFFVHCGGDTAHDGLSPQCPLPSLEDAVEKADCGAGGLDTIIVLPGHTEEVSGPLELDPAKTRVVGHAADSARPSFTIRS